MPTPIRPPIEPFRDNPLWGAKAEDAEPSKRPLWIASAALHVLLLLAVLLLPARLLKHEPRPEKIEITFYAPQKPLPAPAPPRPVETAKVEPPRPEPRPPKPAVKLPPPVEAPRQRALPKPEPVAPRPQPVEPVVRPVVKTGAFAEAEVEPVQAAPQRSAKIAGFAQPQPQETPPARSRRQATRTAGFSAEAAETPIGKPDARVVAAGSFAGGDVAVARKGSAPPAREIVVGSGFATAETGRSQPSERSAAVKQGGFGDSDAPARPTRQRRRPAGNPDTPVEVVSKVKPIYTDEARRMRIEGEVVLQVTFGASGEVRILRVVDPLGYGLDEAAVAAAEKIKFEPARRDGKPVDHTATLRVVFRLA